MKRSNIVIIHAGASGLALLTVLTFFTTTVITEIFGSVEQVAALKEKIFFALPLMLIAMPLLGLSGKELAGKSQAPLVQRKFKRMKLIALNGFLLIMLAASLYLTSRDLRLDITFYLLQGAELLLGGANISLMILSVRDGMLLSGKLKKRNTYDDLVRDKAK